MRRSTMDLLIESFQCFETWRQRVRSSIGRVDRVISRSSGYSYVSKTIPRNGLDFQTHDVKGITDGVFDTMAAFLAAAAIGTMRIMGVARSLRAWRSADLIRSEKGVFGVEGEGTMMIWGIARALRILLALIFTAR